MENIKFPSWHDADEVLLRMSADIGAHVYLRCTDPECPFTLSEHIPVAMLIPYQWFHHVPDQCMKLFEILYNEFADSVFYDINFGEIQQKFIGEGVGEEMRYEMRSALCKALTEYDKKLLAEWDGDLHHPRNLRDKFLDKMCCEMKPICASDENISSYVKEEDKKWVV